MQKVILILALAGLCVGCNTVRKGIAVVDAAASAVGGVKDDAIAAAKTLVNSAESVSTNIAAVVKGN